MSTDAFEIALVRRVFRDELTYAPQLISPVSPGRRGRKKLVAGHIANVLAASHTTTRPRTRTGESVDIHTQMTVSQWKLYQHSMLALASQSADEVVTGGSPLFTGRLLRSLTEFDELLSGAGIPRVVVRTMEDPQRVIEAVVG
ncbi:hypothetical protein [Mycobacterium sp. 852002-10029_SCH5224772]|uniref:hypothetical protein n=1 Tax=Mycobacterium sp. 852002-10029_SCH5224772 TaxID=1834083 RepID=UPI0007FC8C6E|nr:hypothetical protein [Mycobacterium sp. 852002-10029_SCH5224772]OBF11503.1 hypothetical protein A5775_15030 [Mycobacterium sp. 852002-10029_SCH5224772]